LTKPRHRSSRKADARANIRGVRLEGLFREELNSILNSEISDRRLDAARVTRVELSRDGSRARVWYTLGSSSARSDTKDVAALQSAFERACGFMRARLADALPLERTPLLQFRWDPAVAEGDIGNLDVLLD
jgi:ribosome-binding factor A